MKKKITVTYLIENESDMFEFNCAQQGQNMKFAIDDALNSIRNRLKHNDDVSLDETDVLEKLRAILHEGIARVEES